MKPTRTDPTNQNTVPVLDSAGKPLMPTRPSRARRLMRQRRARKRWVKGLFAIQMTDVITDDDDTVVEGTDLNIDPGASATGIAVVSNQDGTRRAHALVELRHRGNRVRNELAKRRTAAAQPTGPPPQPSATLQQPHKTPGLAAAVSGVSPRQHDDVGRTSSSTLSPSDTSASRPPCSTRS